MNKNLLLLLALILLSGLAYLGYQNANSSTNSIDISDREFAIEDVEEIYKIKLTQRTGHKVELSRVDNHWIVGDNKKKVSENIMQNLLSVMQNIQIKYIPQPEFNKKIINEINRIGVQVDLYDKSSKLIKSYFVGGNVADGGTYYIMQGKNQPYVMQRKIGVGGVRNLFHFQEYELCDKTFYSVDPDRITEISMDYPKDKPNSFKLQRTDTDFVIDPLYSTTRRNPTILNQAHAAAYISGFDKIISEANDNDSDVLQKVRDLTPFAVLKWRLDNNDTKEFMFYPVNQFLEGDYEMSTKEILNLQTLERFFVLTDENDLYVCQKQLIMKLFRGYPYFFDR